MGMVQREMVNMMKCQMKVKKMGITAQEDNFSMGSYCPKAADDEPLVTWMAKEIYSIPDAYVAQGDCYGHLKFTTPSGNDLVLCKKVFKFKITGKGKDKDLKQFLAENPAEDMEN